MTFTSADKVQKTIYASDDVERLRGENRVKVNNLLNCVPPLTADQQRKTNTRINVDWGEGAVIAHHARRQYYKAFREMPNFFKVTVPLAPPDKRGDWSTTLTNAINKILKESAAYGHLHDYQWSNVVSHGIAPKIWHSSDGWLPRFAALDDFRVATDTTTDLENLGYFAERRNYTPGELARKVFGEHADPGWNKPAIQTILKAYHKDDWERTTYDWNTAPEKMAELYKQNAGFYSGEAAPSIPLWHFYFEDDNPKKTGWFCRVVPDRYVRGADNIKNKDAFLYSGTKHFATELSHILHVQFGDLSSVAPFKFHSVRSLGFLIMEPCYWTNLFRCRLLQHAWEDMNMLFRSSDPQDRARLQKLELFDRGFIPDSLAIVPREQRHQINDGLAQFVLANLRQLMSEASASYTQSADTGTAKEQTAYETAVKVSMVNAMLSGLLANAFNQETFAYREICRRFCLPKSNNKDIRKFQKEMTAAGIPRIWLDVERWQIEPEIPIGAGNPVMEVSQINQLMGARSLFGPQAQQEILHDFTRITTGDSRRAQRLVPLEGGPVISDGQSFASAIFGTLMQGVPVMPREGLSPIDQIETLLASMAKVISDMEQVGPTQPQLVGLNTAAQFVQQLIAQLAQNEAEKERVKMYSDQLGALMNSVKAMAQQLAEQQSQQGPQMPPEAQAKIASTMAVTEASIRSKEAMQEQKMRHKEMSFQQKQVQGDAATIADIQRENAKVLLAPEKNSAMEDDSQS